MEEDSCVEERESKGHIALEITQLEAARESPITSYLRKELEVVSFPRCIFRVPTKFRSQKEDAYEPTLVSIGPMHHGKHHLQHMENHKWKYLHSLLNRSLTLDTTLECCIQALQALEPKIRACYEEGFSDHIARDEFLTMILLDGAFIIELFLRYYYRGLRTRDDTLLKSREKFHTLANDLILLENQIPFFVLRRIFSLIPLPKKFDKSISELSLKFFKKMILGEVHILHEKYSFDGSNHLLDLIWKCYLPTFHKVPISDSNLGRNIKSASKVRESGIKVRSADAESILDVLFVEGKLLIPSLRIHDHNHMETVLRNLIALEHCYGEKMKYVTSYAYLMRGLLHSEKDVRLFCGQRILLDYVKDKKENVKKDKKEVVNLFKNLCEDVDLEKFYYGGMWEELSNYKWTMCQIFCKLKRKSRLIIRENGMCQATLVLLFVVLMLVGALVVVLYLFFRHERHES